MNWLSFPYRKKFIYSLDKNDIFSPLKWTFIKMNFSIKNRFTKQKLTFLERKSSLSLFKMNCSTLSLIMNFYFQITSFSFKPKVNFLFKWTFLKSRMNLMFKTKTLLFKSKFSKNNLSQPKTSSLDWKWTFLIENN